MPTVAAQTLAHKKVNISAFVEHIREVNEEAARIVSKPWGRYRGGKVAYSRQELRNVLGELEQTVQVLRVATVEHPSAPGRAQLSKVGKSTAKHTDSGAALVLDTNEAMISKKQLVTPVEFQQLMGWTTRQAVWKAVKSQRIFYLTHKAAFYFPAFYSHPMYERKHLEAVTKALGDLPGGAKLQFFLTRKGSLGGDTPLQALANGRLTKVKAVAAAFAEVPTGV